MYYHASMWDTPVIIATVIGVTGLAIALMTLALRVRDGWEGRKRREIRAEVSARFTEGLALAAKVASGDSDRDFAELETRIVAWRDQTLLTLDRAGPEYRPLFESNAGMMFYSSSRHAKRDKLKNYLEGRFARLGEILGRI